MAFNHEEAKETTKQLVEKAVWVALAAGLVAIPIGILFYGLECDIHLAQWNLISGILLLCFSSVCYCGSQLKPQAIVAAYNTASLQIDVKKEAAEGVLHSSLALGLLMFPVLIFVWTATGLLSVRYGTCQFSAPILYALSLMEMITYMTVFLISILNLICGKDFSCDKVKELIISSYNWIKTNGSATILSIWEGSKYYVGVVKDFSLDMACKAKDKLSIGCSSIGNFLCRSGESQPLLG